MLGSEGFLTIYLMLHQGWTVCVGRAFVAAHWLYLVKRGTCLVMQDFIHVGNEGSKHAKMDVSIPTRDDAVAKAQADFKGSTSGLPQPK